MDASPGVQSVPLTAPCDGSRVVLHRSSYSGHTQMAALPNIVPRGWYSAFQIPRQEEVGFAMADL